MSTQIAVIGGSTATQTELHAAGEIGASLALAGVTLVCRGLGGVMASACRGAKSVGGLTVGILPGKDRTSANEWVDVAICSELGEARNALVVNSADVVIAVGGEYGTLSEIALALRVGTPVVGLRTWDLIRPDGTTDAGMVYVDGPQDAVTTALRLAAAPE